MNARHRKIGLARAWVLMGSLTLTQLIIPSGANAHPVVFANGTAIMGHHQGKISEIEVVHSPTSWMGLGLSAERDKKDTTVLGKASLLAWRGNFPDYQSNLYLGVGAGRIWQSNSTNAETSKDATLGVYQWNASWDGEDRQIYSMVSFSKSYQSNSFHHEKGKVRLGFAPYKAQNDELTMWGILEWMPEKMAGQSHWKHEVTPLVRLFYKNALIEMGSSLNGKVTFNYMFHFFR